MKINNKGVIDPVTWIIIALLAAGGILGYKVIQPSRNKKVADQTAAAATVAQQQAAVVKDTAAQVKAAVDQSTTEHAAVIAKRDQIDQNAAGFIAGAKIAVKSDPNPSPADVVAIALLGSAEQAIGQPLTEQQLAVWTQTVGSLIAKNAAAEAQIAKMTADAAALRAGLDATQAHAKASDDHATALAGQLASKAVLLQSETAKSAALAVKNQEWADREPSLWARIKYLAILAGLLAGLVVWYDIKRRGLTGALQDAVALKEHVQAAAVTAGADASKLQSTVSGWWQGAEKDLAKFESVKKTLRL